MTKLTDFQVSNEETTDIELYRIEDWTVIVEWDNESKTYFVFHEADLIYQGDKWSAVADAIGTDFTEDAFRLLDVTFMERK